MRMIVACISAAPINACTHYPECSWGTPVRTGSCRTANEGLLASNSEKLEWNAGQMWDGMGTRWGVRCAQVGCGTSSKLQAAASKQLTHLDGPARLA